ncbi:hypothetical protein EV663_10487 [Rhodovulum bhavnagarense]|uniref:Uncharacterized protein n=1 Tax=Rhodovulum bhavnagarense TaxID=992286 RepID=A0A4V2SWB2_9RHOB|nr:hypothetical protein [Rhodovulum bhavnagarense]TCP61636.1 hypothetical protein EV663_10487 [Rhodovulum bhavnagarense]
MIPIRIALLPLAAALGIGAIPGLADAPPDNGAVLLVAGTTGEGQEIVPWPFLPDGASPPEAPAAPLVSPHRVFPHSGVNNTPAPAPGADPGAGATWPNVIVPAPSDDTGPAFPERRRPRSIPDECVKTVQTKRGPRRVATGECLAGAGLFNLPDICLVPENRVESGNRKVYNLRCLNRYGYGVAD